MEKITLAQKLANARAKAVETLTLPEDAKLVGVGEYAFYVAEGEAVTVKITAKKADYDVDGEAEAYAYEIADKARIKAEKDAIKAKEKEAKIAAKNAKANAKS